MSKRFTDTNKWDHSWFRKLSPKFKCAWFYILDKCDHAGIWIEDLEAMSFNIGDTITQVELITVFKDKLQKIDADKFLIESFVEYQYGNLNPNNKVHKSVLVKLEKIQGATKGLPSSINEAKDKDKDKDQDKDKEKETGEIPRDLFETIKINYQYPDAIIEEVRKDAWLQYLASDKKDKNWRRFVGHYFKNEKEKIRELILRLSQPNKKPNVLDMENPYPTDEVYSA